MKKYLVIIAFLSLLLSCEDNSTEPTIDNNPLKGFNNLSSFDIKVNVNDYAFIERNGIEAYGDTLLKDGYTYLYKLKTLTNDSLHPYDKTTIQVTFSKDWSKIDTLNYYYRYDHFSNQYSSSTKMESLTFLNLDYTFSNGILTILSTDSLSNSNYDKFNDYYSYAQKSGKLDPGTSGGYDHSFNKEQVKKLIFNIQLVFAKQ